MKHQDIYYDLEFSFRQVNMEFSKNREWGVTESSSDIDISLVSGKLGGLRIYHELNRKRNLSLFEYSAGDSYHQHEVKSNQSITSCSLLSRVV